MINTADIKQKVMRLWGNPSLTELTPQSLRDAIETAWNIITAEISVASPHCLVKFSDSFTLPDGYTGSVTVPDAAVPIAVDYRSSGSAESDWVEVETADPANWNFYKENNQPVALLTGQLDALELRTNFYATGEFRVRYVSDGQSGDSNSPVATAFSLPSFFSPMLEKGAAAAAGDLIVTDREDFRAQIPVKQAAYNTEFLMFLSRFKDWLRASRAKKGVQFRTPSNAGRRIRRWNTGLPR